MRSAKEVKIVSLLPCCSFISRYVCPVLVSVLAISATLIVTMSILHWNYVENNKRKVSIEADSDGDGDDDDGDDAGQQEDDHPQPLGQAEARGVRP